MNDADTASALITVFVSALTQIGIPGVFIFAWWQERAAHAKTTIAYIEDLREINRQKAISDIASVAARSAREGVNSAP